MDFIHNNKYILTEDLGEESWLKKNSILTAIKSDGGHLTFTNPTIVFLGMESVSIEDVTNIISLEDYHSLYKYETIYKSKSAKLNVVGNVVEANLSYNKRDESSQSVAYNYYVTENNIIKIMKSGYCQEKDLPTIAEVIASYKNN